MNIQKIYRIWIRSQKINIRSPLVQCTRAPLTLTANITTNQLILLLVT